MTQDSTTRAAATSTLAFPLVVTASFLEHTLDEVLDGLRPETTGLLHQHEDVDIGHGLVGTAQVWRRGNTHIVMVDDTVVATLPVRVVILPAWKPHLGSLSLPTEIQIGVDLTAEYTVRLRARPQLDADYNLRLNATFEYEIDRHVGIEALGVTFSGATRDAAEGALTALGDWLNSDEFHYLNFRAEAERGWFALQEPITLSPGHHLRLAIAPLGIHALPFHNEDNSGQFGLAVIAQVSALAVAAADAPAAPVPLPPITAGDTAQGVDLQLPLEVSFATLEAALRDNVAHHPWQFDSRRFVLRAVEVAGDDDGVLTVRVDVAVTSDSGGFEVEGRIAASGKPRLDVGTQHLALEDFRYDMRSDSTLLNVIATLLRPFAGAILEPWLGLPLAPQAERALVEINNRLAGGIALAEGVTLGGHAAGVRLTGLSVSAQALSVELATHGTLVIAVDRQG